MKHVVTILPETFLDSNYDINCALTKTLWKKFPLAKEIIVDHSSFYISFHDGKVIRRRFIACQLESHDKFEHTLEDLICDNHFTKEPEAVTFNFLTA